MERGREMAKAKASSRCVRCVAVRKIRKWLTAARRPQRGMERVREMAKAKVPRRCVRCVAVRSFQKVAHGGTATTARNGEGARGGESKSPQPLCSLCRCEKNQKVAHGGTAATAQNGERADEMAKAKASNRCVRCVAVRKIRRWLTAARRPQRRMERGRTRWRKQKSPAAVFAVSL